ncbi:uncharacterized protein LOC125777296 [Bactrocera dorsalis]|uniref:Uncharacterized protein LOC125777296 n=1 Tax=Bactrocera dorsalis TaxID=27457 RepID=A0ABM3JER2_BACDO|nr:uncharacterized protein LOC125777296 [Bactrocera dorsalis]
MNLKSAVKLLPGNNQYLKTDVPLNGILSTGRSSGRGFARFVKQYPVLGAIISIILLLVGILSCLKKCGCCDEPEKEQMNAVVHQDATYPTQNSDPEAQNLNTFPTQNADPEAQNRNTIHE